jgi:light-regulated signal transduction histidine kinase (bacteriophytochrome)
VIVTGLSRPFDLLFRDLKARNAELESANRELETFNYTVSHDLRTPLTTINGYADLLGQLYGDRLDEQGKGFLQEIHSGTSRMNRIISDLLQFSRIGRQQLNRQDLDLSDMVWAIVRDLQVADPCRRVEVSVAEGALCHGDPGLLRQALTNLLDNAWKYSGKRERARIEFGVERHDGETVYVVRDNGAGFDMDQAHRLFGTFERLHDDKEFQGTGIGLATVQRIIELHGGRVWAEGVEGEGASFYFTLGA